MPLDKNKLEKLKARYESWKDQQLLDIVRMKDQYETEAVQIAVEELKRRGLESAIKEILQEENLENAAEEMTEEAIRETFDHIGQSATYIEIQPGSAVQFLLDQHLDAHEIKYYKVETNEFTFPLDRYYFSAEDYEEIALYMAEWETGIEMQEEEYEEPLEPTFMMRVSENIDKVFLYVFIPLILAAMIYLILVNL